MPYSPAPPPPPTPHIPALLTTSSAQSPRDRPLWAATPGPGAGAPPRAAWPRGGGRREAGRPGSAQPPPAGRAAFLGGRRSDVDPGAASGAGGARLGGFLNPPPRPGRHFPSTAPPPEGEREREREKARGQGARSPAESGQPGAREKLRAARRRAASPAVAPTAPRQRPDSAFSRNPARAPQTAQRPARPGPCQDDEQQRLLGGRGPRPGGRGGRHAVHGEGPGGGRAVEEDPAEHVHALVQRAPQVRGQAPHRPAARPQRRAAPHRAARGAQPEAHVPQVPSAPQFPPDEAGERVRGSRVPRARAHQAGVHRSVRAGSRECPEDGMARGDRGHRCRWGRGAESSPWHREGTLAPAVQPPAPATRGLPSRPSLHGGGGGGGCRKGPGSPSFSHTLPPSRLCS